MRILIIGGDAAGMSAAMQIRRQQPEWKVTVLEKGEFTSYAACGIPYYFAGDVGSMDELVVVGPEEFRTQRGVDLHTGAEAVGLDSVARVVSARLRDGGSESFSYDRLLIATGAVAIVPRWDGVDLEGVLPVRNLADARRLDALLAERPANAVIVGAGYIGLEMAEALRRRGVAVTVLEKLPGVMGGVEKAFTEQALAEMDRHGVTAHLETTVEAFEGKEGRVSAVRTDRGAFPAELVILSLGVRPNVELARDGGVPLGETGAIRVDDRQRTGVADVLAAGDCAEAFHRVLGRPAWIPLALTANRQGRVAGAVLSDGDACFPGVVGSAVTRVFDLTLARTGLDEPTLEKEGIPFEAVEVSAPSKAHYFPGHGPVWVKLLYRSDDRRLLGAFLAGHDPAAGKRADILATAMSAEMTVDQVAELDLTYAPPFAPVWDPVLQAANKAVFRRQARKTREAASR